MQQSKLISTEHYLSNTNLKTDSLKALHPT